MRWDVLGSASRPYERLLCSGRPAANGHGTRKEVGEPLGKHTVVRALEKKGTQCQSFGDGASVCGRRHATTRGADTRTAPHHADSRRQACTREPSTSTYQYLKKVLMSSSATQTVVVQQGLRQSGLEVQRVRSVRDSGIDATLRRKWRVTCAAKRRPQAYARLHKLSRKIPRIGTQANAPDDEHTPHSYLWHRTSRRKCELRRVTAWESSEDGVQARQIWCFWNVVTHRAPSVDFPAPVPQDIVAEQVLDGNARQKDLQTSNYELAGDVLQDPWQPCSFVSRIWVGILCCRTRGSIQTLQPGPLRELMPLPRVGHACATRHRG